MTKMFNIYCDESCHLENDNCNVMVIGAVGCMDDAKQEAFSRIRDIKRKHGFHPVWETKWTKVSDKKLAFYIDLVDYFFDNDDLKFRVLIVPDKTQLQHDKFGQTHDQFYYKMYFSMLKGILNTDCKNNIYIDIKDTCGGHKIKELKNVLRNDYYDYSEEKIVNRIQITKSHEIELMQLADLLIGAVSYTNRGIITSKAKLAVINRIKERSSYSLTKSTYLTETKFNIFKWRAQE
ncbi:MAG TPA: DUF3800 domain-containing protein [Candidatus Margulisbacteria bacterium]|nr:DUF3800 domain-containing protein [Candidatus Margulisiibacteriota bacterium]